MRKAVNSFGYEYTDSIWPDKKYSFILQQKQRNLDVYWVDAGIIFFFLSSNNRTGEREEAG